MIEHSSQDLSPQYGPLLAILQPFFSPAEHSAPAVYNARDNAAGALSRMILKNPAALPLEQVIPVLVGVMPLQFDPLENKALYSALFMLFRTRSEVLMPHIGQLLKAFAYNLDPAHEDDMTEESRAELRALVDHLKQTVPEQVAQAGL